MTQRILITGGAGFIGSRLAKSLCADHEVMVFEIFIRKFMGMRGSKKRPG